MLLKRFFFVLFLKLVVVFSDDDDYEPSQNDIDIFFDLCNEFLDTMASCGQYWMDTESLMIDQIGEMSDRIVYTETLILDEAEQIGYMSDRIVETEYILSNLTVVCIPMCDVTLENDHRQLKQNNDEEQQKEEEEELGDDKIIKSFLLNQMPILNHNELLLPISLMCSPLSSFNQVLNESLIVFDQLCYNITTGIDFMTLQIGIMADRIVATECLIMDMSKQIGIMSDRVVETEELMSNLSTSCCQSFEEKEEKQKQIKEDGKKETMNENYLNNKKAIKQKEGLQTDVKDEPPPTPAECLNYTNDDTLKSFPTMHDGKSSMKSNPIYMSYYKQLLQKQTSSQEEEEENKNVITMIPRIDTNNNHREQQQHQHLNDNVHKMNKERKKGPMPCDTWWNPFCCAMEIMTEMMVDMIDEMGNVGSQIITLMESSSLLIGQLSDDIVEMEHEIMNMSLLIGEMGDDIVDIEAWGLEFMDSLMCSSDLNSIKSTDSDSDSGSSFLFLMNKQNENHEKEEQEQEIKNKRRLELVIKSKTILNKYQLSSDPDLNIEKSSSSLSNHVKKLQNNLKKDNDNILSTSSSKSESDLKSNPFGKFADMVDLMIEMANTMTSLMTEELSEMKQIVQACSDMSQQIIKTMSLMYDMSQQIEIMAGRMITTTQLMENLLEDCVPTE